MSGKAAKNSGETPPADPPVTDPPVEDPPATDPPADPPEETDPPVDTPAPTEQPSNRAPGAPAFAVTFADGAVLTDPAAVQTRVKVLEQFQSDTQVSNRKAFVKQLASDGKILASGMDEIEKFALSLSPETYDSWCTSWNAVSKSTVLQTPAVLPSQGSATVKDEADQIAIWEDTVKSHKRGGMRDDAIKQTESYKNLIAAKPDFKL